jgi:hypothetical protein
MCPVGSLDREQDLMMAWADSRPIRPDFGPERHVVMLMQALGEICGTLNASDGGPDRWSVAAPDLLTVLMLCVDLRVHSGLTVLRGDMWPDGTRVGGDGAYRVGISPRHLLGEVMQAAGWVAEWALTGTDRIESRRTEASELFVAEPITELEARTWCLIDRLRLHGSLRLMIRDEVAGDRPADAGSRPNSR